MGDDYKLGKGFKSLLDYMKNPYLTLQASNHVHNPLSQSEVQ